MYGYTAVACRRERGGYLALPTSMYCTKRKYIYFIVAGTVAEKPQRREQLRPRVHVRAAQADAHRQALHHEPRPDRVRRLLVRQSRVHRRGVSSQQRANDGSISLWRHSAARRCVSRRWLSDLCQPTTTATCATLLGVNTPFLWVYATGESGYYWPVTTNSQAARHPAHRTHLPLLLYFEANWLEVRIASGQLASWLRQRRLYDQPVCLC